MLQVQKEKIIELKTLNEIENPDYIFETIKVSAVIASNTISYNVPIKLEGKCFGKQFKKKGTEHTCIVSTEWEIPLEHLAKFTEIREDKREQLCKKLLREVGPFTNNCALQAIELKHTTVKRMRVRPIVSSLEKSDGKFFDSEGNEWKAFDIYLDQKILQHHEAGKEVELTGIVIPDPKSQRVALMVSKAKITEIQDYNLENVKQLKEFLDKKTLNEKIKWIKDEFENYSKIVKRGDITLCVFLTFFSPLFFEFGKKTIPGWIKSSILGDTTTGKSETVRCAIMLFNAGQIITGETSTKAGLGGAATQSANNTWFIEFGALVLQDRKLLAIDGAHKLRLDQWDELAEAERSGKIIITKAAKGEAYARTRQIKIMNPLGDDFRITQSMESFFYPCQAIQNNLQKQTIARQDLAVFVCDDVNAADRNKQNGPEPEKELSYFSDLLGLVWSQNHKIIFSEDAVKEVLDKATELEKSFKYDAIPLITNDEKEKLAKLAASLAAISCSFDSDFKQLNVTKEHVEAVYNIKNNEYHNAGLDVLSARNIDEVDDDLIKQIIEEMRLALKRHNKEIDDLKACEILQWVGKQTKFTKEKFQKEFELSRDHEERPFTNYFSNDIGIIERKKNGFTPTKKGIKVARYIVERGVSIFTEAATAVSAKTQGDLKEIDDS